MKKNGKAKNSPGKSVSMQYRPDRKAALAARSPATLVIEAKSEAEMPKELAREVTGPTLASAIAITPLWKKMTSSDLDLTDVRNSLKEAGEKIKDGDLSDVEAMLYSQAAALNIMFAEMNRRAVGALYDGRSFEAGKAYMGLALKAQAQSRATLEALGNIKNGPMIYARQANVNNGGQQQVNNGTASRAEKEAIPPSKLLEKSNEQRMDTGTAGQAGGSDPALEAVGAVNRAKVT